jgi:hypothetical protein
MKNSFMYLLFIAVLSLATKYNLYAVNPHSFCPAISTINEVNSIINNNNNKINPIVPYQNKWVVPLYNGNSTDEKYPLFIPLKLSTYPELTIIQAASQSLDGEFCFYEIRFKPQPAISDDVAYVVGRFTLKNTRSPLTPPQNK